MNTRVDLNGQVAIVTGAGRGIGQAIASGYAAAGAAVVCVARTATEVNATASAIEAAGGRALAVTADVTDAAQVTALADTAASTFGGVDILVANAGISADRRSVVDSRPEDWMHTFEVNVHAVYHCVRAVVPHLRRRGGGKIITLGSGLGHRGQPGNAAYACTKAALWMLTRVLAQELFEDGISVNELVPGPVATPLTVSEQAAGASVFGIGSEWVKSPQDVVPLALFLASQPAIGPSAQSFSLMRRDG